MKPKVHTLRVEKDSVVTSGPARIRLKKVRGQRATLMVDAGHESPCLHLAAEAYKASRRSVEGGGDLQEAWRNWCLFSVAQLSEWMGEPLNEVQFVKICSTIGRSEAWRPAPPSFSDGGLPQVA